MKKYQERKRNLKEKKRKNQTEKEKKHKHTLLPKLLLRMIGIETKSA
jgi:hypothetical protein